MKNTKLKPPMSFQGGKQKVADNLTSILYEEDANYIDLCCGSGAVTLSLINKGVPPTDITMVDSSEWGLFWWQISTSSFDYCWFEDAIAEIPTNRDLIKDHLVSIAKEDFELDVDIIPLWLVLQAGSFGGKHIWTKEGKWCNASFRSYWKPTATSSRRSPVNPMMPMPNTLLTQVKNLIQPMESVNAVHGKVESFDFGYYHKFVKAKENVVVFIDPPYKGTTGYGEGFDYESWLAEGKIPKDYSVWITDYQAHSDESYILSKTNKGGISGNSKKSRVEILSKVQ